MPFVPDAAAAAAARLLPLVLEDVTPYQPERVDLPSPPPPFPIPDGRKRRDNIALIAALGEAGYALGFCPVDALSKPHWGVRGNVIALFYRRGTEHEDADVDALLMTVARYFGVAGFETFG